MMATNGTNENHKIRFKYIFFFLPVDDSIERKRVGERENEGD